MEQRGANGLAMCQRGYAARQQPGRRSAGGGRSDPIARRRRGCEPARSRWSSAPSPEGVDGSPLGGPLRKVSPTEPILLRSWELRVVPPGTVGPPGTSKRNANGETNRIDCVRTMHETVNVMDNTRLAAAEGENQLPKAVQSVICRDGVEVINTLNQSAAATVSSKVQHSSRHDAARLSAARGLGADGRRGAGIRVDVKHWPSPSRRGARHALEAVSIIRGGQACRIPTMIRDQAVRGRRKGEHP